MGRMRQLSQTWTHREERETPGVPKENDFFVVPRSDELLAAEASTKPELIELSAGDSSQQAMAQPRCITSASFCFVRQLQSQSV